MYKQNTLNPLSNPAIRKRTLLLEACNKLVRDRDFIVFDTETTGLKSDDEIIQIAILNPLTMEPLMDSLVKPTKSIPKEATAIHGLTDTDVQDAPTFNKIYHQLSTIFNESKQVVIYNADYDIRMLRQSRKPYGLPPFSIETDPKMVICAMKIFSGFVGEWNGRTNDFKWQRLPGGGHRASLDCTATLNVLRRVTLGIESSFIGDLLCGCGHLKGLYTDSWGRFSYCTNCDEFTAMGPWETLNSDAYQRDNNARPSIDCVGSGRAVGDLQEDPSDLPF